MKGRGLSKKDLLIQMMMLLLILMMIIVLLGMMNGCVSKKVKSKSELKLTNPLLERRSHIPH